MIYEVTLSNPYSATTHFGGVTLMANLSSYGSDVLSKVPHSKNTHNDMLNQSVQEMSYSEQTHLVNYPENEIIRDSNIGTDIQKESQKRPNQARDGKDKVNPKPKSVKVKSQSHEENTT
ncbi:hypothetical protein Tco_0284461 [Tanacetum coccineum]